MKHKIGIVVGVGVAVSMMLTGCVCDGTVAKVRESYYEPGICEREGLALARILTSPYNMVGHTYGEYRRWCEEYPLRSIALPLVSIPSGCLAACADILTGTTEMLTFQQFKSVSYPWESFDKAKSKKWAEPVIITYAVAAVALAACAAAENDCDCDAPPPPPPPPGHDSVAPTGGRASGSHAKQRVRHSSCNGTGKCNICHGKGYLGNDPKNSRLRCRGCGGSGRCRPCGGTGYAN